MRLTPSAPAAASPVTARMVAVAAPATAARSPRAAADAREPGQGGGRTGRAGGGPRAAMRGTGHPVGAKGVARPSSEMGAAWQTGGHTACPCAPALQRASTGAGAVRAGAHHELSFARGGLRGGLSRRAERRQARLIAVPETRLLAAGARGCVSACVCVRGWVRGGGLTAQSRGASRPSATASRPRPGTRIPRRRCRRRHGDAPAPARAAAARG